MAVPVFSLLALLVLGGMVFFGVCLFAGLFFHKQTRPVGLAILGVLVLGGLLIGARGVAMQQAERARRAQAQSEMRAVAAEMAAEAHGGHWEEIGHTFPAHGGDPWQEAGRFSSGHNFPSPAQGGVQFGARMSWLGIAVVAVILVAVMKLLNRDRGLSATGWLGLAGLGLVVLVVALNYLSFSRPQPAVMVSNTVVPPLTATEAWDEITRPRIQLEATSDAAGFPDGWVRLRMANHTGYLSEGFLLNGPEEDSLAVVEERQAVLGPGEVLKMEIGDKSFDVRGRTSRERIAKWIAEVRAESSGEPVADAEVADAVERAVEAAEPAAAESDSSDQGASLAESAPKPSSAALPEWVEHTPPRIGEVYRQVIQVGPYVNEDECWDHVGAKLTGSAQEFAKRHLPFKPTPELMSHLGFSEGVLLRDIVVDRHVETHFSEAAGQDMKILHLRLEFDQEFVDQLDHAYKRWRRGDVVEGLALTAGAVLLLVGGVFGLLKLDEATKGYYTKRLFIGVPAAIIGVFLLVVALDAMGIVI